MMRYLACFAITSVLLAQTQAVVPKNGPPPVGPYTPGVIADGYLYVSGQGAKTPQGVMPEAFTEQVKQTLENVKTIVAAAGLTMDHVVYTQVYLEDMSKQAEMDQVYRNYFQKDPPARAVLGVAKLPGTPVEINAVAVVSRENRRPVTVPGFNSTQPFSAGMLTADRLFISSLPGYGKEAKTPAEEASAALDGMKAVTEAAGLSLAHVVFVNSYLTQAMPMDVMNKQYAQRFEFGNTPARATISVASLPTGSVAFTGVAVRDLAKRKAIRPKNMAPSATASPCVFAGDTLYCSAKSGFIPGPHSGIYAATVEHQLRQTMRNLLDNLEEAGMGFSDVVATNVYLDNLDEFTRMNAVYAQYFAEGTKPARTTVQQLMPGKRDPDANGRYATFEQVSLIAVRAKTSQ